jgi:hypothetical protein
MGKRPRHWNLYWVESDGLEDCFVVARNSRSACSVESRENGFEIEFARAVKIMRVPRSAEISYKRSIDYKRPWPGYVYGKKFFKHLGAQFRKNEKQEEMLLQEVVYNVDRYAPCEMIKARSIGAKALAEMEREIPDPKHDEEDIWQAPVIHLITALGICVVRCQQIEHYIANSFILGISKKQKQKQKYKTIDDLRAGWKRKTLGNMLMSIEEAWIIHPVVKVSFELFLENRNALIHGIATSDQYDLRTLWGQHELLAFLRFFDIHSRMVKKAFRASYYASIDFGIKNWGTPPGTPQKIFNKKQKEEMGLFVEFFSPRLDSI